MRTFANYSGYFHPERFLQLGNEVFAAGQGFNVFRTRDFGASWETIAGGGPGLLDVRTFVAHQRYDDVVWLGGKTGFSTEFIAKSSDGLNSWAFLHPIENINGSGVSCIVLDPADTNIVYAGLQNFESIKTADGGQTWEVLFESGALSLLIDPDERTHLWMASETFYGRPMIQVPPGCL